MDELVLNNRRLKLVDGEISVWMDYKHNPCWRKVKYTNSSKKYLLFELFAKQKRKCYQVHRVIYKFYNPEWNMTYTPDNLVDHIDNCRTNNNIENLRVVNSSENAQNTLSTKGYSFNKQTNKYRAKITLNYKDYHLGCYDTEEEARDAYLIGKAKYHTH